METILSEGLEFNELTAVSLIKVADISSLITINGVDFANFTFSTPTIAEWTAVTTAAGYPIMPSAAGIYAGGL